MTGALAFAFYLLLTVLNGNYRCCVYEVDGGYGYDIYQKGVLIIHQPSVPVLEGSQPFPDRAAALNTARMVKRKLEKGDNPSLTLSEISRTLNYDH